MAKTKQKTPLERHDEIKRSNPGVVLLFRTGDFYEAFREDAEIAARVLGLTLTTMTKSSDDPVTKVGFPFHSLDDSLRKLIEAGYRCSICN
ncbi:DNA mismatch repair protein MutS [Gimesia alba]|uniref:DNA mismatch repair protein MutS n=1 Tax=Gimesia alba TaxID=2527973 RepID=A0A517RB25_9PLAN|nr:hypothetical protein [Gimesia alba]QDT41085.1 DNA mismatch repair protein MutS [Gimesia alba]